MKLLLNKDGEDGGDSGNIFDNVDDSSQQTQTGSTGAGTETGGDDDDAQSGAAGDDKGKPPSGLTAEDIANAIKQAGLGGQTQQAQQPKYSQEDFDKAFNIYKPDADLLTKLRSDKPDEAVSALAQLTAGINKQAITMASYLVQQAKEELANQMSPLTAHIQAENEKRLWGEFTEENPELSQYESLVRAVVDQMKAQGYTAKNKKEAFGEVRSRALTILKTAGITPSASNGKQQNQPGSMPRLPSGGQGGSAGKGTSSRQKGPPGMEIFQT